ncbi:probable beta-hexosaminidase fdl [Zerene cesonia]|uniref:probable beta-hexosaminidase fdl n=1 Tax=Zerene cesonia TaxID=33412 RepID=UPI0018E4E958|nr:probable beta-hexosaminidase fdl [Zerene cesonia]
MYSDEASCSDCKLELVERKWTEVLINWLNKCVYQTDEVFDLNLRNLVEIINRYKEDICSDDLNRALLCTDDLEPYIGYKYPILRLRDLYQASDQPKKVYIMTSILLFHCCINSQNGQVEKDICEKLSIEEQEIILKFCEALSEMEATVNNVDTAIKEACDVNKSRINDKQDLPLEDIDTSQSTMRMTSSSDTLKPKKPTLTFKSSITVLPSVITDTSLSRSSFDAYSDVSNYKTYGKLDISDMVSSDSKDTVEMRPQCLQDSFERPNCQVDCNCVRCSASTSCCVDPGSSMDKCDPPVEKNTEREWDKWKLYTIISGVLVLVALVVVLCTIPLWRSKPKKVKAVRLHEETSYHLPDWLWKCSDGFCDKVYRPNTNENLYTSMSRCKLLCSGPQLWPYPIGYTYFSKTIVALATNKLEYKFQSVPSDAVHQYLAEAFKIFLKDVARLEKIDTKSRNRTRENVKKMIIQIDVESDPDPRLRLNTEEAYTLKIETVDDQVVIKISAVSFCGVRHGLETLSQIILLDQSTGSLITLSHAVIKDAPSYKYRGLMIDTARNYIPVIDLMRTIDAMAMCKLNTFHWRISDVTSFPMELLSVSELKEYGAYERALIYTRKDVKSIVKRAGVRGIRVLIEVALPGPVGRPWMWLPEATCPTKDDNFTCNNIPCLRLPMQASVFEIIQNIYTEILELTNVDDIFHLSDSMFSFTHCNNLLEDREGFLDKALFRLKMANKGFLPKLPIIWYSNHLTRDFEARIWDRLGVQLYVWDQNPEEFLTKFKVIHSTKWDLSCEMSKQRCIKYRSWQDMYGWKSWRNLEVFTIEGGEAVLWTDLVDTGNLDDHLWPRAAAVAERLWSDVVANSSANKYVYARLDTHRWRMLLRGIKVQPIWPAWCSFHPSKCLQRIN